MIKIQEDMSNNSDLTGIDLQQALVYLEKFIKNNPYSECDIDTTDGYSISLFWHEPSINLAYYPILQIDDVNGKTLFWREGSENPVHYKDIVKTAREKFRL